MNTFPLNPKIHISSSGLMGIGTSAPSAPLVFNSQGTERFRLTSDGLLIQSDNPVVWWTPITTDEKIKLLFNCEDETLSSFKDHSLINDYKTIIDIIEFSDILDKEELFLVWKHRHVINWRNVSVYSKASFNFLYAFEKYVEWNETIMMHPHLTPSDMRRILTTESIHLSINQIVNYALSITDEHVREFESEIQWGSLPDAKRLVQKITDEYICELTMRGLLSI